MDKLRFGPAEGELEEVALDAGEATTSAAKEVSMVTMVVAKTVDRKVTDGCVKSKFFAQYLYESALEVSEIDIDVANGVVTLNGTVKTAAGKARAVAIAKDTDRVSGVKDNLKVG